MVPPAELGPAADRDRSPQHLHRRPRRPRPVRTVGAPDGAELRRRKDQRSAGQGDRGGRRLQDGPGQPRGRAPDPSAQGRCHHRHQLERDLRETLSGGRPVPGAAHPRNRLRDHHAHGRRLVLPALHVPSVQQHEEPGARDGALGPPARRQEVVRSLHGLRLGPVGGVRLSEEPREPGRDLGRPRRHPDRHARLRPAPQPDPRGRGRADPRLLRRRRHPLRAGDAPDGAQQEGEARRPRLARRCEHRAAARASGRGHLFAPPLPGGEERQGHAVRRRAQQEISGCPSSSSPASSARRSAGSFERSATTRSGPGSSGTTRPGSRSSAQR